MKSKYFREYFCSFSSKSYYFYILGVSHLNTWRRHQMAAVSALLTLCEGNSSVTGEFPSQRPVTRSFDVFYDLRPNKRLNWLYNQSTGWWFEAPSRSLWRHCNVVCQTDSYREISYWWNFAWIVVVSASFFVTWWTDYFFFANDNVWWWFVTYAD